MNYDRASIRRDNRLLAVGSESGVKQLAAMALDWKAPAALVPLKGHPE
jgi:hypothetical protein